jgi:hypothetical protein
MSVFYIHRAESFTQIKLWFLLIGWSRDLRYIRIIGWYGIDAGRISSEPFSLRMRIKPAVRVCGWYVTFFNK